MNTAKKFLYILLLFFAGGIAFAVFAQTSSGSVASYLSKPSYSVPLVAVQNSPQLTVIAPSAPNIPLAQGPRLIIPSVKIDAAIENVGVDAKGNMAVPGRLADVGWYKDSAAPGASGVTVMAGHVDNALTRPAVFYYLHNVKVGDDIYVIGSSGQKIHYVVTNVSEYAALNAPVEHIFHDLENSKPTLRLITCKKISGTGHAAYTQRVVVTAVLA